MQNSNVNNYLLNLLQPTSGASAAIPDITQTPKRPKKTVISLNLPVPTSASGTTPQLLVVFLPNGPRRVCLLYVLWPSQGIQTWAYWRTINEDQDISENYDSARMVSAFLGVSGGTVAPSDLTIQGSINATQVQRMPNLNDIGADGLLAFKRNDRDQLITGDISDGVFALGIPAGTGEFFTPGTNASVDIGKGVVFNFAPPVSFDPATGPVFQYDVPIFTRGAALINLNANVSNPTPSDPPGSLIFNVAAQVYKFDPNLNTASYVTVYNRSVTFSDTVPGSVSGSFSEFYIPASTDVGQGPISRFTVFCIPNSWEAGSLASFRLQTTFVEHYDEGTTGPVSLMQFQSLAPDTSLLFAGVINREVVPDATLSKELQTDTYEIGQGLPSDITEAMVLLSTGFRSEPRIKMLGTLKSYNENVKNNVILSFCERENVRKATASGLLSMLGGVAQGLIGQIPVIGPIGSALLGGILGSLGGTSQPQASVSMSRDGGYGSETPVNRRYAPEANAMGTYRASSAGTYRAEAGGTYAGASGAYRASGRLVKAPNSDRPSGAFASGSLVVRTSTNDEDERERPFGAHCSGKLSVPEIEQEKHRANTIELIRKLEARIKENGGGFTRFEPSEPDADFTPCKVASAPLPRETPKEGPHHTDCSPIGMTGVKPVVSKVGTIETQVLESAQQIGASKVLIPEPNAFDFSYSFMSSYVKVRGSVHARDLVNKFGATPQDMERLIARLKAKESPGPKGWYRVTIPPSSVPEALMLSTTRATCSGKVARGRAPILTPSQVVGVELKNQPMEHQPESPAPSFSSYYDPEYAERMDKYYSGELLSLKYGFAKFPIVLLSDSLFGEAKEVVIGTVTVSDVPVAAKKWTKYQATGKTVGGESYDITFKVNSDVILNPDALASVASALICAGIDDQWVYIPPVTGIEKDISGSSLGCATYCAALRLPAGPLITGGMYTQQAGFLVPIDQLDDKIDFAVETKLPIVFVSETGSDITALAGNFEGAGVIGVSTTGALVAGCLMGAGYLFYQKRKGDLDSKKSISATIAKGTKEATRLASIASQAPREAASSVPLEEFIALAPGEKKGGKSFNISEVLKKSFPDDMYTKIVRGWKDPKKKGDIIGLATRKYTEMNNNGEKSKKLNSERLVTIYKKASVVVKVMEDGFGPKGDEAVAAREEILDFKDLYNRFTVLSPKAASTAKGIEAREEAAKAGAQVSPFLNKFYGEGVYAKSGGAALAKAIAKHSGGSDKGSAPKRASALSTAVEAGKRRKVTAMSEGAREGPAAGTDDYASDEDPDAEGAEGEEGEEEDVDFSKY